MKQRLAKLFIFLSLLTYGGCKHSNRERSPAPFSEKLAFDPSLEIKFRPNIVWLVAEDLSPMIPPFGDSTISTPNLNRLAKEGVRYINVFSPSGVCAPSRHALVTGMYPTSTGGHNMRVQYVKSHMDKLGLILYEVVLPPEARMMSQVLRESGYYCTNNDKQDYQFRPPATGWDDSSLKAHWRNRKPGQPFFSVFNFDITHESHVWSPISKAETRYDDPKFPAIKMEKYSHGERIKPEDWKMNLPEYQEVPVPPYLPATDTVKKDIRRVYSNIIEMDRQVGRLLSQLEMDGLLDSTIIFWYSDNGGPLPRQKRLLYESGIHIPCLIRFPGMAGAGAYDDQLISFVDFAPTVFSLAGIKAPGYIQGQAFLGKYKSDKERMHIFAAADRLDTEIDMIRAVRNKRYKYLKNFYPSKPYYLPVSFRERIPTMRELLRMNESNSLDEYQSQWFREEKPEEELYDISADPHELHNIANDPANSAIIAELRIACETWMNETGDLGMVPEKDLIELFWPGRRQPKTENLSYQIIDQEVNLFCKTEGANIGCQVLGLDTEPEEAWDIYSKSIKIKPYTRILAVAHRIGFTPSDTLKIEFR